MPDWNAFSLSYHSLSVFTPLLMSTLLTLFLLLKRGKSIPTWWLAASFFGYTVMFSGYFLAYTYLDEGGARHRWMTVFVMLAQATLITFSYFYPRFDRPKEAYVMIPIMWLISIVGYGQFVYNSLDLEPYYDFTAHHYNINLGRIVSGLILLQLLWVLAVFWRKTVRYSDEHLGSNRVQRPESLFSFRLFPFLLKRAVIGPLHIIRPKGKDAIASRGFFIGAVLLVTIGMCNALNKAGILTYGTYAVLYGTLSLVSVFVMFLAYLNNSPEPTTFMVKLVGISLLTVLIILGLVSDYALTLNEASYDRERAAEVQNSRRAVVNGDYDVLPPSFAYIARRPAGPGAFHDDLELLWSRADGVTQSSIREGREQRRELWIRTATERLAKQEGTEGLSPDEIQNLARESERNYQLPVLNAPGEPVTSAMRLYRVAGRFYTHFDFVDGETRYEVGFSYDAYRAYVNQVALGFLGVILVSTFAILLIFPLFFRGSVLNPLNWLLSGVKRVNEGDLDVTVPIKVQDEIGYLAGSFNSMVASIKDARERLQDYAHNLEEKVEERTKEVREKMEEVQRLKVQQDGDYFLTSLLAAPLFYNANKSNLVSTRFYIRQKKQFEFRERHGELGGDICVSGNLRLGTQEKHSRYTVALNGDAMGKSMQGAGGSLVMGVVMNSIMARSAANDRILDTTPEQWLTDVYREVHGVFKSFDGSMVISAVLFLIEEESGEAWYFNAEHPATVRYRNGGASFIEEELLLRKLGLESEIPFAVQRTKVEAGDVLILGSDGRDDLLFGHDKAGRVINEDEFLFLKMVEEGNGDLPTIVRLLEERGELTDDLSLLRLGFHETVEPSADYSNRDVDRSDPEAIYEKARDLYREGRLDEALSTLGEADHIDHSNMKLKKLLGLLSFKGQDYEKAVEVLTDYLEQDPEMPDFLFYLSVSEKKLGNHKAALEAAERLLSLQPENVNNLIHIGDLHRLMGDADRAKSFLEQAEQVDPQNKNIDRLRQMLAR